MIRKATTADIPAMVALQQSVAAENAIWGYVADKPEIWAGEARFEKTVMRDGAENGR